MKSSKNWPLVALVFLILIGLSVTVYFVIQPRPVPKISWSHFSDSREFAQAVSHRLRLEIRDSRLLFLGVDPEVQEHYLVWKEFLIQQKTEGQAIDVLGIDPYLPFKSLWTASLGEVVGEILEIDFNQEMERAFGGIEESLKSQKRVAFLVPSLFSSQLLKISPASRAKERGLSPMSFSLSLFPRKREDEKNLSFPCLSENRDIQGTRDLGCMILQKSRTLYRKKSIPGKWPGVVDQVGVKDYLALYNTTSL